MTMYRLVVIEYINIFNTHDYFLDIKNVEWN